jgi:uroporphyrinogen-III synthase
VTSLAGMRVIVTRAPHQAEELCAALESRGATAVRLPTVAIYRGEPVPELDAALASLSAYSWAVFTSVNTVESVLRHAEARGIAPDAWGCVAVAAIGEATARALRGRGVPVRVVAAEPSTDGVVAALGDVNMCAILLPQSDLARPALAHALEARGASVRAVTAYRTLPQAPAPGEMTAALLGAHAVTFASPSAVAGFAQGLAALDATRGLCCAIASIGPVTSAALRAAGFSVDAEARDANATGLAVALEMHFAGRAAEAGAHA